MKKQITLLLAASLLWISAAFAGNSQDIPRQVSQNFSKEYTQASDINWIDGSEFYRVNFTLNGQNLFAFYTADGQKMGLARYIASGQLPLSLQKAIWDKFDSYWLTDLFEYATDEGTSYYVTLENADEQLILKGSGSSWSVFKKSAKA